MKINYIRLFTAIIGFFMCAQFSQNASTDVREKPKINIMGQVCDTSSNCFDVENITISGMWKQIPVYSKPRKNNLSPEANTTRLDLDEIKEIRVPNQDDAPLTYKFKNREYIEIEVILHDGTKNSYIIDRSRKVYCDRTTGAGPQEKELSFEAIEKLIIYSSKENIQPKKQLKNSTEEIGHREI